MASQAFNFATTSNSYLDPVHHMETSDRLLELETMLFDPAIRRDTTTVADLLAEDFREFGGSGRTYTKMDILAELSTEHPARITLSDFQCELLAPTVALVTYKSLATHESRPGSQALRSSLWVLRTPDRRYGQAAPPESVWRMQFHQGTRY